MAHQFRIAQREELTRISLDKERELQDLAQQHQVQMYNLKLENQRISQENQLEIERDDIKLYLIVYKKTKP